MTALSLLLLSAFAVLPRVSGQVCITQTCITSSLALSSVNNFASLTVTQSGSLTCALSACSLNASGPIYLYGTLTTSTAALSITGDTVVIQGNVSSSLHLGAVNITARAALNISGRVTASAIALSAPTVINSGFVLTDGLGYAAGDYYAPGKGGNGDYSATILDYATGAGGGGGGYGGAGGQGGQYAGVSWPLGFTYGSSALPLSFGSQGGDGMCYICDSGNSKLGYAGGGAIAVTSALLELSEGVFSSNGASISSFTGTGGGYVATSGGAGSGGSVFFNVTLLQGTGIVSAQGGAAMGGAFGGSGGGGRIFFSTAPPSTITVSSAAGGRQGYAPNARGTTYQGGLGSDGSLCYLIRGAIYCFPSPLSGTSFSCAAAAGSYCAAGTSLSSVNCPSGAYCPGSPVFPCPNGTFSTAGSLLCQPCSASPGFWCPAGGAVPIGAASCPAGYVCFGGTPALATPCLTPSLCTATGLSEEPFCVWNVSTLAGNSATGYSDGRGTQALFNGGQLAMTNNIDAIYLAEAGMHIIRKITPTGDASTFAGMSGNSGYEDGIGTTTRFNFPCALAFDPKSGLIAVIDRSNYRVRMVNPFGYTTTLAGSGFSGNSDGRGTAASFELMVSIAIDSAGLIYVASSNGNIRLVYPTGMVATRRP